MERDYFSSRASGSELVQEPDLFVSGDFGVGALDRSIDHGQMTERVLTPGIDEHLDVAHDIVRAEVASAPARRDWWWSPGHAFESLPIDQLLGITSESCHSDSLGDGCRWTLRSGHETPRLIIIYPEPAVLQFHLEDPIMDHQTRSYPVDLLSVAGRERQPMLQVVAFRDDWHQIFSVQADGVYHEASIRIDPLAVDRRTQLDGLADELEQQGVRFVRLPVGLYPGLRLVSPAELAKQGVTKYTRHHISSLIRDGELVAHDIGGWMLDAAGVQWLLDREAASRSASRAGRKPGADGKRPRRLPRA